MKVKTYEVISTDLRTGKRDRIFTGFNQTEAEAIATKRHYAATALNVHTTAYFVERGADVTLTAAGIARVANNSLNVEAA